MTLLWPSVLLEGHQCLLKVIQVLVVGFRIPQNGSLTWFVLSNRDIFLSFVFKYKKAVTEYFFKFFYFFWGLVALIRTLCRCTWRNQLVFNVWSHQLILHTEVQTILNNGHIQKQGKVDVCCDLPLLGAKLFRKARKFFFWKTMKYQKWIWDGLLSPFLYFKALMRHTTNGHNCKRLCSMNALVFVWN